MPAESGHLLHSQHSLTMEPLRPRPVQPVPSTVPERPTPDMLHLPEVPMTNSQPALASRTNRSALILIVLALWVPLCYLVAAAAGLVGVDLDVSAWLAYADDDVITPAEWLAMGRDLIMALLAAAVIYFRTTALKMISGVFRRNG